jgi:hypothetical protein
MTPDDPWIGVAEVAAELRYTEAEAWRLIRRIGVPMLEPDRARMKAARFRRSAWEARRDARTGPPAPRYREARYAAVAPTTRPTTSGAASKLAKLRGA